MSTTTTNVANHNKTLVDQNKVEKNISSRMTKNKVFKGIFLACTLIGLI
ncbi:phosphate ABC transporter, permease protein PstA, partial [Staphylococcus lugdunensis]